MEKFYINGKNSLNGEIKISGSKNSILSILSVSLLSNENILIKNVPNINDVLITIEILKNLGSKIEFYNSSIYINNSYVNKYCLSYKLSSLIRSSILMLSPLLHKFKISKTFFPGGCNFCERPIDLHLKIFKNFGINSIVNKKIIKIYLFKKKILGTNIFIEKISVGATITAISLATLADGITIIHNIAKEPEIIDTINFLNTLGANIIINNNKLIIKGVKKLYGGIYSIISDRIETGTFLIAGAITMGEITCLNTNPNLLKNVINILKLSGVKIKFGKNWIYLNMKNKPKAISFSTNPYPGFPTDLQPQFTVLNSISLGNSIIEENVFNYRFSHVNELLKMKANLYLYKNKIICKGVNDLFGNYVNAKDLRSSISLILSGLCAIGQTVVIDKSNYVYRGYENLLFKLKSIGAKIITSKV